MRCAPIWLLALLLAVCASGRAAEGELSPAEWDAHAQLVQFIYWENPTEVRQFLERYPHLINHPAPLSLDRFPLHLAAAHSNPEVVRVLLAHGADPWQQNSAGDTALELILPDPQRRSLFSILRRLDATQSYRPERVAILQQLYRAQQGPIDIGILGAFLVLALGLSLWIRHWVRQHGAEFHGAGAEAALDRISARTDWRDLLAKFEQAQAFQRRVFLHRPWILIGALGWTAGVLFLWYDPVLTLLVEPGAWWLVGLFSGGFLAACGLQFAHRSALRILGAAVGIVTLSVSCFYAGVADYLMFAYPQLFLLGTVFGVMILATLTAAWRFHRTLKAEIGLRRIKLPPELDLLRQAAMDGAEIEPPAGWDEGSTNKTGNGP